MHEAEHSRTEAFVLRVWLEPFGDDVEGGEWRGELKRVRDGTSRYFRGMDGMTETLRELLGLEPGEA
jgi:hypothetical protein